MPAILIDGRQMAARFCQDIGRDVAVFTGKTGRPPGLAVLLAGDNPASQVYVRNKQKACKLVGIRSEVHILPTGTSQEEILDKIDVLNSRQDVHGILVQLPLPGHIQTSAIINQIAVVKDVDGLHPQNLGLLLTGQPRFIPCTPQGCLHLIRSVMPDMAGRRAVVVGRSVLVGRPAGLLLGFENATVVQTHSATVNLQDECRQADILVCAAGKPGLITAAYVKPGAVVIDVGITRVSGADGTHSLKGDVAFNEVREIAGFITPVPGGVGPMTVACLLANTLKAAQGMI